MQTPLDPGLEIRLCAIASRTNVNKAFHRSPSEIHWADVRLRKSLFVLLWTNSDNKILAHDAAAHMAINHERQTTEHSPFLGKTFFRGNVADSLGQTFIEGHRGSAATEFRQTDFRQHCDRRSPAPELQAIL